MRKANFNNNHNKNAILFHLLWMLTEDVIISLQGRLVEIESLIFVNYSSVFETAEYQFSLRKTFSSSLSPLHPQQMQVHHLSICCFLGGGHSWRPPGKRKCIPLPVCREMYLEWGLTGLSFASSLSLWNHSLWREQNRGYVGFDWLQRGREMTACET